jgi:hypothetical protein
MSENKVNNVDQIRDLIFGSQIKEFDEKFNRMDANIKSMHEEIRQGFQKAHEKLQRETERAMEVLEKKIDNLSVTTQKERTKLKDLVDTLDEGLQEKIGLQKDEFDTKLKIMKENVSDEHQNITALIKSTRDDLDRMLKSELSTLSDNKLSRESMAQMLLEVAMKIQGTDMTAAVLDKDVKTEK